MSGVKILAPGLLVLMLFADTPARGGSIRPASSRWVAAQNLANSSSTPAASSDPNQNAGYVVRQAGASGLFLGMSSSSPDQGTASTATTAATAPAPSSPSPSAADAFVNFGAGPYSEASSLTAGNAQPFFDSPAFTHLFGPGGPTSADITHFENEVISTVQKTYNDAGLAINLTTDPNAPAAHTMSVVSGATWVGNPNAIGITDVGHDGFSFIDKLSSATNVDQLAVAVGHNVSHELMHAFGIADHPEQTGAFVDAAASTFQALADPSTAFSPIASQLLSTLDFQAVGSSIAAGSQGVDGNQILLPSDPATVPEPSTVALWGLAGGLLVAYRRRVAA